MPEVKKTSWRQATVTLAPKTVNEYVFQDTKPNHVLLNNLGAGALYLGVTTIPERDIYDMKVAPYGENLYAQETGFTRVQIYNDGTDPVIIKITSFEHDFSPTSIKPINVESATGGNTGSDGTTVISGFNAPLPSGNNNIGRVIVTSMPDIDMTFDSLPTGTNNIGRVNVDTMPPLTQGNSHIGSVGIDGGVTISSMPPVTLANPDEPVRQSHEFFESVVGVNEVIFDLGGRNMLTIEFITNDDPDNDLFISFDETPITPATSNGANGVIRLRPNESITDMNRMCTIIRFIRNVEGGNVRVLGV